jgi:hypothetical protein
MRLADVTNPATRLVLHGTVLSRFTSSELAYVLTDPDFGVAAGETHQDAEAGILGELQARARKGDPIARSTLARYVEPGDFVVCACGLTHEADYCPTLAGHGALL